MRDAIERQLGRSTAALLDASARIEHLEAENKRLWSIINRQHRRVRNFSAPDDVFYAVPLRAFGGELPSRDAAADKPPLEDRDAYNLRVHGLREEDLP